MLFTHKESGKSYRAISNAFSIELQKMVVIYIQVGTGAMFTREQEDFQKKFKMEHPAEGYIKPKRPKAFHISQEEIDETMLMALKARKMFEAYVEKITVNDEKES